MERELKREAFAQVEGRLIPRPPDVGRGAVDGTFVEKSDVAINPK